MSIANNEEKDGNEDGTRLLSEAVEPFTDQVAIICICDSEVDDNATIQCDRCGRWQHMRCVGIDPVLVDLDDLVYHCDQCEPRPLDVDAAKAYIERFQLEEVQTSQTKPRRGRGKGSGRRGGGNGSSPGTRTDGRRARANNKTADSDDGDDLVDTTVTNSSLRDYTLVERYLATPEARDWMGTHEKDYPICPADFAPQSIPTHVKAISGPTGVVRGLFATNQTPPSAVVGRYLGEIQTQEQYRNEPCNRFEELQGPGANVAFVHQCDLAIDARVSGNETRFMRRSCTPNCSVIPLLVKSENDNEIEWQFSIALQQSIRAGEELTLGYQWPVDIPERLPSINNSAETLASFARIVSSVFGPCACRLPADECLVAKWLPPTQLPRKRSLTGERDDVESAAISERHRSGEATPDQPMTREERKIQMAIARMENADVPKTKRRRRNTGDDQNRPSHNRRASTMKPDENSIPSEDQHRSPSPPIPVKTVRAPRPVIRSRSKLIRSPSPEHENNENLPHKMLWLRTFMKEKAIKEEQVLRLAEQAKEATARLAEEVTKKKLEIETQAKEAQEIKEREAELVREKAEREAKEAMQRAREREIWGDHHSSTSSAPTFVSSGPVAEERLPSPASHVSNPIPLTVVATRDSPTSRVNSPTAMGPPPLPRESSRPSPPAAIIPKIVRKLSVSEYMRQRKEKAATDVSASPNTDAHPEGNDLDGIQPRRDDDDDKSDGEIDSGEVNDFKSEVTNQKRFSPPTAPRAGFVPIAPTAPKAATLHHGYGPPQGTSMYQSRAHPMNYYGHGAVSSQANHFQQPYSPRHGNFGTDQRQYRHNGFPSSGNSHHGQNTGPSMNDDIHQRGPGGVPTGPKFSRSNGPYIEQAPGPPYHSMNNSVHNGDSDRGPPSRAP